MDLIVCSPVCLSVYLCACLFVWTWCSLFMCVGLLSGSKNIFLIIRGSLFYPKKTEYLCMFVSPSQRSYWPDLNEIWNGDKLLNTTKTVFHPGKNWKNFWKKT